MNRPVVIVDPLESGIELAPAFRARGVPAIAVTIKTQPWDGFGLTLQSEDFIEVIPDQPNLAEILKKYDPIAILPGTEESVALAENLTMALTPEFANLPEKSLHRRHKAMMQNALIDAQVPVLKTLSAASESLVATWLEENHLLDKPLIIKPPMSAGSDKVFHIPPRGDWRNAFNQVLSEPARLTGKKSETVVVQEEAIGTEFAIGTVSVNGKHTVAHIIKYHKTSCAGRKTVFDYVEYVPYCEATYGSLFDYAKKTLDALGVRWGAAHIEIMLTNNGPRLIEMGARMCGGPTVEFARVATGSSQADKLVEAFLQDDIHETTYDFKQSVMPVFLKSPATGVISNIEVFDEAFALPTLYKPFIWIQNGDSVPQTVDYLTSIGIIALAGDRDSILQDYKKIREMESRLVVVS